jgi:hypothetical protein
MEVAKWVEAVVGIRGASGCESGVVTGGEWGARDGVVRPLRVGL